MTDLSFKVWIFTFSGSGNPYYSTYLLELYCCFKWEFPAPLQDAILMNWLVNLHGLPGFFVEMDLMQEHFNFWLEDMVQHKGKEFDDPFYREIVSANVFQFLRLKEEMEDAVSLKARSKTHKEPHLRNELAAVMNLLRENEVNRRRPGRHEGFEAVDDFSAGISALEKDKIKNFIARTTTHIDIEGQQHIAPGTDNAEGEPIDNEDDWAMRARDELPRGPDIHQPPPVMRMVDGELYIPST